MFKYPKLYNIFANPNLFLRLVEEFNPLIVIQKKFDGANYRAIKSNEAEENSLGFNINGWKFYLKVGTRNKEYLNPNEAKWFMIDLKGEEILKIWEQLQFSYQVFFEFLWYKMPRFLDRKIVEEEGSKVILFDSVFLQSKNNYRVGPLEDKYNERIVLKDIVVDNPIALLKFLQFLYEDKAKDFEGLVIKLYFQKDGWQNLVGKKYQLLNLVGFKYKPFLIRKLYKPKILNVFKPKILKDFEDQKEKGKIYIEQITKFSIELDKKLPEYIR